MDKRTPCRFLLDCQGAPSRFGFHAAASLMVASSDISQIRGSGASADNSPSSGADASPVTLVSDGKRPEIRHLCFAACWSSVRQRPFSRPKSPDAPEPVGAEIHFDHVNFAQSFNAKTTTPKRKIAKVNTSQVLHCASRPCDFSASDPKERPRGESCAGAVRFTSSRSDSSVLRDSCKTS